VPEQPDLLPSMLHLRRCSRVTGRVDDHRSEAIGVRIARRQAEEQLDARVPEGCCEDEPDILRLSPPVRDLVDERAHATQPFVAEAVESPVHRSLCPTSQGAEGGRDREYCEGRHPGRPSADRDTREQRDDGVHEGERRSQNRVDESAVDQPVDFVQPVARYCNAHGDCHRRLHREQKGDHGVAGSAEHEIPEKETNDPQRNEQSRIGQPKHLQPLCPPGAPVANPRRRGADEEACKDGQPGECSQKTESVWQPQRERIRHVRERRLEPIRHHEHQHQNDQRTGGEERVRAPAPRRQPAVREHECNRQRPGEERRPQRRDQCGP
jgi:hypothetical protein